jgi:hypothetical protein
MRLRCGRAGVLVLAIVVATAHAAAADGLRADDLKAARSE